MWQIFLTIFATAWAVLYLQNILPYFFNWLDGRCYHFPQEYIPGDGANALWKLQELHGSVCGVCGRHILVSEITIDYSEKWKRFTDHYILRCACEEPHIVIFPTLASPKNELQEEYREEM